MGILFKVFVSVSVRDKLGVVQFLKKHTIPIVNLMCHSFLGKPVSLNTYIREQSYIFSEILRSDEDVSQ